MPQTRNNLLLRLLVIDEAQLPSVPSSPLFGPWPVQLAAAAAIAANAAPSAAGLPPSTPTGNTPPPSPPPAAGTVVFQPDGHPKQALIDGEVWPPSFEAETVRSAKQLVPLETDVFVCTYPKCGTTWIQHICSQLLYTGNYGPEQGKELCMSSPMIERMGATFCNQLAHPRLLKTHFSCANCPKSGGNTKYIYAVRNPKDCCVSYFHHNRNFKIYNWADGEFDVFFELFMQGKLAFGDYFDHLLSWLPHCNDPNVLFLKYEDMLADLEGTIHKIGTFLGGTAAELVAQWEWLERVVAESRLDAMRQNQTRWFPGSALHKPMFIRNGCSRDWKNYMSKEQSDRLDRLFQQRLAGTPAAQWWRDEMRWEAANDEEDGDTEEEEEEKEEEENDSGVESDRESCCSSNTIRSCGNHGTEDDDDGTINSGNSSRRHSIDDGGRDSVVTQQEAEEEQ